MALIKIYKKGHRPLTIPSGSLKKYLATGWSTSRPTKEKKVDTPVETEVEDEDVYTPGTDSKLPQEDEQTEDTENDEEFEEVDPEELEKRPLSELDKEELQILAEYKGLDISSLTTVKQLREALKSLE